MAKYVIFKAHGDFDKRVFMTEHGTSIAPRFEILAVVEGVSPGLAYTDWCRHLHPEALATSTEARRASGDDDPAVWEIIHGTS